MYPNRPWAVPYGSFQNPVDIIDVDPDSDPKVTVCFNSAYLPVVIGSLQQLLLQTTWKTDDAAVLALQQQRVTDLIGLFQPDVSGCGGSPCPGPAWRLTPGGNLAYTGGVEGNFKGIGGATYLVAQFGGYVTVQGRDVNPPYAFCGGVFEEFGVWSSNGIDPIACFYTDCVDQNHFGNVVGHGTNVDFGFGTDVEAKSVTVTATGPAWFYALTRGPITCGNV